jgi:hypothetical protein
MIASLTDDDKERTIELESGPMRTLAPALIVSLLCLGCAEHPPMPEEAGYQAATAPIPSYEEYKTVWQATYKVMKEHYLIRISRFEDGMIVATSEISAPAGTKQRLKIVAHVVEDEDGFFEPQIRVHQQVDMSVITPFRASVNSSNYRWRDIGFNHRAEAGLVEAVYREMRGGRDNPQTGNAFQVSRTDRTPSLGPEHSPRQ